MFTRKLSTTLFIALAILVATSTVVEASHDSPLQQRDHVNLKRIIKKRTPQLPPPVVIGAAPIPTDSSTSQSASGTPASTAAVSDTASSSSTTATDSTSASTTATNTSTSSGSATDSQSTTTTSTATESTSTNAAASTSTPAPDAQVTPAPDQPAVQTSTDKVKSTKTVVTSVQASSTSVPQMTHAATVSSNVLTILIAIVASAGGILVLWTIFRKWKLSSSKKFESRMKPIDWRPETGDDDALPTRRLSGSSAASLHRGPSSARSGNLTPLPDHDFTAGPGQVSPVGGYADMSRGPSPTMRENHYGVPLHSGGRY